MMEARTNKILEEIHPLNIIREIQKWPVLYAKDGSERAGAHFKNKIWLEVAKALFDNWDEFDERVQEQKLSDLNKKWRNLRDTFKRQLLTEKKIRDGYDIKRKTYVYFKHMLFLLPHIAPVEDDPGLEPKLDEFFNKHGKRKASKIKSTKKSKRASEAASEPVPTKFVEVDLDADRHFLLSLIPSFQSMTEDEKLTAKVEILKVIKKVKKRKAEGEFGAPEADSLTFDVDDAELGEVKIEALHSEANEVQIASNDSDSERETGSDYTSPSLVL